MTILAVGPCVAEEEREPTHPWEVCWVYWQMVWLLSTREVPLKQGLLTFSVPVWLNKELYQNRPIKQEPMGKDGLSILGFKSNPNKNGCFFILEKKEYKWLLTYWELNKRY